MSSGLFETVANLANILQEAKQWVSKDLNPSLLMLMRTALHEQIVTSVQDMLYLSKDSSASESSSTAEPYLKDPSS